MRDDERYQKKRAGSEVADCNHVSILLNINARSVVNKVVDHESLILTYSPHVIVVTETWLNHDIADHEIVPPGYRMLRKDRDRRGGGVAVILRDELLVTRLADIPDLECLWVKTGLGEVTIIIGACYRPP